MPNDKATWLAGLAVDDELVLLSRRQELRNTITRIVSRMRLRWSTNRREEVLSRIDRIDWRCLPIATLETVADLVTRAGKAGR